MTVYKRDATLFSGLPADLAMSSVSLPSRGAYVGVNHSNCAGWTISVTGTDADGAASEEFVLTAQPRELGEVEFRSIATLSGAGFTTGTRSLSVRMVNRSGDPLQVLQLHGTVKGNMLPQSQKMVQGTVGASARREGYLVTLPYALQPGWVVNVNSRDWELLTADPVENSAGLETHRQCSVVEWRGD